MSNQQAIPIMVQGTHSDAGKSILVTALCRIFAQDGYETAPFKSQNMALNSYVTLDGKEIGRAQGVQAEAAKIIATTNMNPILIKPTRDYEAQVVVHGVPLSNMQAKAYRSEFYDSAKNIIELAYMELASSYERIVIEGAGSPAEVNLNDRELVNMSVARMADAPVLLVGDIDKGGVFASLVGTLQLLSEEDRNRVIGVVINKFRGDLSLLEPGLSWFEEYTGKPILGVIPFLEDLQIDAEDSLSLTKYSTAKNEHKDIDIAVIHYPKISNFTDIDPLCHEIDCHVRFVNLPEELGQPDLIVLPGSKSTIEDLTYIKQRGLDIAIINAHLNGSAIFGICGGYQMLGETIKDPYQVESSAKEAQGLSLLSIETILAQTKTTIRSNGEVEIAGESLKVSGYEIHMGQSISDTSLPSFIKLSDRSEGSKNEEEMLFGTYFHGIFHNDGFRSHFLNLIRKEKNLLPLDNRPLFQDRQEHEFNRLADHVRGAINIPNLYKKIEQFTKRK
ncbi:cobyric acid synthase [Bacillus sp. CGMCC 1.16607]|uniref:cobyric acid synthase n=1 Tax=Bacillus sp. CGMCC 1.16607 TaxID=3351842 RepID=UPI00363BA1DE